MEEFLKDNWLSLAIVVVQAVWGWILWSLKKQFVSVEAHNEGQTKHGERMGDAEGEITTIKHRLDVVERDFKSQPTAQSISNLNVELEKLRGEMKGFRSEMQGQRDFMKRTERQITLLIENELKGARNE